VPRRNNAMPSKEELPDGPRREFVTELRRYYRAAGRPAYRKISQAIEDSTDFEKGITASQETVRRILRGMVLPLEQARLNAIFRVLCDMAKVNPDADRWDGRYEDDTETNWQHLWRLWDTALEDEAEAPDVPRPSPPPPPPPQSSLRGRAAAPDPWANGPSYSDEPPF
jgi:hypothetical protein